MELPSGWVQVLRGPRPPSVKWPSASQHSANAVISKPKQVGRWRQPGPQSSETVRERGLDPDKALLEARRRVASLEAAVQAMGDFQGPEMDVLQSALAKAKSAARTRPLKEQIAQNDAFIQRSQKRIASLDRERATEQELLDQALVRQERLKQEMAVAESVPTEGPAQECNAEVLFFRAKVAKLEAERIPHPVRGSVDAAESVRKRLSKRKRGIAQRTTSPQIHKTSILGWSRGSWSCEMPSTFTTWNQSIC